MKAKPVTLSVEFDRSQIDLILSKVERLTQVLKEAKSLINDLASCELDLEFDVES